jgi:glycogen(starch) synthase
MRIAFVTIEYVTEVGFDGGLSNYLYRVCLALKQMGHEPFVIVTSDKDELLIHDDIEVYRVKRPWKLWVHRLNRLTLGKFEVLFQLLLQSWNINKKLKNIHQNKPVDIVQYTNLNGLGCFRLKKITSVVRLSGHTRLCHLAGGYNYKSTLQLNQEVWMEQLSMKRMDGVFGPSKFIANIISKEIKKSISIIETPYFNNSITFDDSLFKEKISNKKYLLFFGSLSLIKGTDLIGDIIKDFFDKYENYYFVFVGKDGKERNGESIIDTIKKKAFEFNDRVIYLGKIKHEQLYPIICSSSAVILPSRMDNFPNTCIEAMAHGKVVVGPRGNSFDQLIIDGESGFLFENESIRSLMGKIDEVMALDSNQRNKIGVMAKKRIEELNPAQVVVQLLNYYSNLILSH